jgi:molybdopterin/thiamine biosynthesis adenylyltransferase
MDHRRYLRQSILAEIGEQGQQALAKSKVLMIGAGGLGSPAAMYLATAGIGQLTLVDDDEVEITNLGRQILHGDADIGKAKVSSAQATLSSLNPDIKIETIRDRFNENNAAELVDDHDFIIDGCDNFTTKFLINDSCVLKGKAYSHAGVLSWGGQTFTHIPGSPCYRCLFDEPPPPEAVPNCSEAGVVGPVVGLLGSVQATEAIKYLIGMENSLLLGQLLTVDALEMKFRKVQFPKNPKCRVCSELATIKDIKEDGVVQCDLKQTEADKWLITFENSQKVLKAERQLKQQNFKVEPRVTPRQLSNECGICLQLEADEADSGKQALQAVDLNWVRFVTLQDFSG